MPPSTRWRIIVSMFARSPVRRLVEHVAQLEDVVDVLLDEAQHLLRVRAFALQRVTDLRPT